MAAALALSLAIGALAAVAGVLVLREERDHRPGGRRGARRADRAAVEAFIASRGGRDA